MKTFQEFREDLSKSVVSLGKKEQESLNKSRKNQIGPNSRPVPNIKFTIQPLNIPMK